jgi:amino acid adenylation domain-containing protein
MTKKNSLETGLEIAVIGMAGKFPGAKNLEEFWKNLKNGEESISFFSNEELIECGISEALLNQPNYVKAFGAIEAREYFDASFFGYSPKEAETLDPLIRLFHECSWQALENAGCDSMSYNGSIGVYAGAPDGFGWQVALRLKNINDQTEDAFGHMTDCSLLISSRVSHKLNLKGPSITLFTACSTGLVTIHTACRALLTGECDMALAGAGAVLPSGKTGYLYQEGMILSPDGHCRAFDEKAKGTIYGEGVGVVLLKRLKDARADGDSIKCIIKASAVNNDGTGKASFTAPGKKRIADVIRTVLKLARVEPDDIGCIEAHGTATALGDAIEIEALKEAFDTGKKAFCGIGSIKTNIGHLDVAAGMAGFIKAALAIIHKHIPPSLHFEIPNPDIDFIDSPFYINNELSQWGGETGGSPLRAGVCSFGVGGTNAFILLEGATLPATAQDKKPQLLLLSARTDSALDTMTHNLVQYFKKNSSNPGLLADAAYTLQVGRRAFSRRRMLVCSTVEQAIEALSLTGNDNNDNNGRVRTSAAKGKGRPLDQALMDKLLNVFQSGEPAGEAEETLTKIGMAWLNGAKIPWQELYAKYFKDPGQQRYRIPLPTYPFERERFWFDVAPLEFSISLPGAEREEQGGEAAAVEEEVSAGLYPRPPLSTEYAAPRDDVEQALVGVWQKFFGIREVGIDDDFFELGGDSLKAITVVTEIHKQMNTRVPVTEIFQSPTIKKLAQYIKGAEKVEYAAIEPVEEREYYPLSSAQKRLYILYQMNPGSTGYHDTLFFEVEGQPDKERLEKVFNNLAARHESLRTSFELIGGDTVQRIHEDVEFEMEYYELATEVTEETEERRNIQNSFVRPFDLSRAPLLRVGLMGITGDKHILMVDMHHIITDGSSIGILIREFMTIYTGGSLPSLRIRYKDYTQWQNSEKQREVIKRQEVYWLRVFEDEIPVLNFPTDYVRPAVQGFEGNTRAFIIPREETEALKKVASNQDVTLFMILLSVYDVMLAKICGQEDIVVGTPVAARTHADLHNVIGMFVNTLALRNYPTAEKTFKEFLKEARKNTLAAFENQDYLFEDLVERVTGTGKWNRDPGRNPVFDTLFNILNIQSQYEANLEIKSPGLSLKPCEYKKETSEFDLIFQGGEEIDGLSFTVFFSTRLFKPETIDRVIGYFKKIVSAAAALPDIKLSEIEIISGEEKQQLLADFNETAAEFPRDKTIHELFAEQVERIPDGVAVVGAAPRGRPDTVVQHLTYKELNQKSDQVARVLKEKGVLTDSIIGIMMERSIEMIIDILGILKAGGAYLPIDPENPQERIDYMLKDSGAKLLVTTNNLEAPGFPLLPAAGHRPPATSLAYIIYTSGTTGIPKGVLIRHRGVINMVNCHRRVFGESLGERVSQAASPGFDAMAFEIWPCLLSGAALYIVENEVRANPVELKNWLIKEGINISFLPTIMAEELLEGEWPEQGVCLRVLRTAGDRLKKYPPRIYPFRFYNLYGPTEDTVWTTWTEVEVKEKINEHTTKYPPIGKPIDNHRVYILSSNLKLQPIGIPGELCIAGEGLSLGYLNNPELTAEKFDQDEEKKENYQKFFGGSRGAILQKSPPGRRRLYRTGDLGRWLTDGNIEFLGRTDYQVKIRGYRLELGEIERCLAASEGVKEAVVTARSDETGEKYLCAYVVTQNEPGINVSLLRQKLAARLPGHMIPSYFIKIDRIPMTTSGKVDRRALPEPDTTRPQLTSDYLAAGTEMEKLIADTWQNVLNVDKIGINDNFFDLGGNSVNLVKVIVTLRKILNREIPTQSLFQYPTVYLLARHITEEEQTGIATTEKKEHPDKPDKGIKIVPEKMKYRPIEPVESKEYYPLSSAQKRLYFLQQMDIASIAYNIPFVLPLGRDIEPARLEAVLKQLVDRHESLRTSFIRVKDEPVQKVHNPDEIDFASEYYKIEEGNEKIIERFARPFDLSRAPLIRSGIIKCADGNLIWMVDEHHIVSDGTSHTILADDFFHLYNRSRLEPLRIQYKDFSLWQNHLFESGALKTREDYWLTLYSDIKEIPRLNLMGDHKRPEVFTFAGDNYAFVLGGNDAVRFKSPGARAGGTLHMSLLAVLNILFYKCTGQTDIIIGSGIAGRSHADLQDIIGMFVNMLAMRNYPDGEKTYQAFLKEVIDHSIQAFENQDVQFEELVDRLGPERDPSRNPLFDISMMVQNFRQLGEKGLRENDSRKKEPFGQVEQLPAVRADEDIPAVKYDNKTAKFDLTFFFYEHGEDIHVTIEYYTGIFEEETIRRLAAHFRNVIMAVIKDPTIKLKDIGIITEEEKQQVLYDFNDTDREFPTDKTVHQLFEEQAERSPEGTALVGSGQWAVGKKEKMYITYGVLNEKADQLAHYLIHEKNMLPGDRVGIWMSPSLYRPVTILGVLKAGAAYVPIDPSLPAARIKYMINDASIPVVISEKKFIKELNRLQWECRDFHGYLCVDSFDIRGEDEIERNELMNEELWNHVGETAVDDITGGGWVSSYTGEPLSRKEMDEYGDNILKKLTPLLHPRMRVLEIGCASGIGMYRIAPRVGLYYGTDLSPVMIDRNKKRLEKEGHRNIRLSCLAAHEIDKIAERNFDLVIMNSVIQYFHGHNYLREVIRKAVDLLGERGCLFIGDVMDQEKKDDLIRELTAFKQDSKNKSYTTRTDFSQELFVSREFWTDLAAEWREIERIEFTEKIYTVENELTRFRYDTLIGINKKPSAAKKKWVKRKYQDDRRSLSVFGSGALDLELSPGNLAYIIYTSGTTGRPKGAAIEHGSLVNLCYWHNRYYHITPADNITLYAGFGFDVSVWELFPYLIKGAAIHLLDDSIKLDIDALNAYYERNHISVSFLPTQFCEQFMAQENRSLRLLLTAGDRLRTFVKRSYDLYNNYGPTENTVITTAYYVEKQLDNIPIGMPVDNNRVYILDPASLQPQPVGVAGELCIAGVGLSRGYLNSPELTAERFVDYRSYRSYRTYFSEKIYKTGDLARWLANGDIEFLGRIDQQVKIRGYRIELGDIESQLLAAEGIKEAVVTPREDEKDQKYLCAYVVLKQGHAADMSALRSEVSAHLPEYMVPAYFMQLDGIPLTPNGKVDRRKLPKPEIVIRKGYEAPRDAVEDKLVEIWTDLLNMPKENIGIDTNFFYLGGHSLKATILTAKIHKELNVKVPLARVFTTPTIKELAEFIRRTRKERHRSIEPAEEKEYYLLSSAQKRLYVLHQFASDSIFYNMPDVIEPEKTLDKEKLEQAFKKLIARHESLRTSFETVREEPVQKVHKEVDFFIDHYEMDEVDTEAIISRFTRTFELSRAPLLRVNLVNTGTSRQVLFMDMHHIITDGTSQEILKKELAAFYSKQGDTLPLLKLQYKDYSQWLNSEEQEKLRKQQETYWLREFLDNDELPVLNLPTDYPRPSLQSSEGNWVDFVLSARETGILKHTAKENDVTLYMILLAVFNVLFSKLSGQDDIIIGSPIAARRHTDLQYVIGMMVNTLPMRNYPSGDKPFDRFLEEVKQRTLDAYENQEYPFEELVEHLSVARDTSRNPVFDIMLNVLNQAEYPGEIPGMDDQPPYRHRKMTSRFDMLFNVVDLEKRIYFNLEYSTRLFAPGTIEHFIQYLKNIILSLAGNTGQKIMDIEYMPGVEKEAILEFCIGVKDIAGAEPTVHQLFEEKAREVPDKTALVFEDRHLGYGELNRRSDRLARLLEEKGVRGDTVVGVMVKRSLEMIVTLLAILKAGGAYLPIDPEYPEERIDYMLKDSGAKLLVTTYNLEAPEFPLLPATGNRQPAASLVYIIYTSGSTGTPKGAMLEHRNLVNLIRFDYCHTIIDFSRVLQFSTISFDASAQEIFAALLAGGLLALVDENTLKDIPQLFRVVEKEHLKTLFAPASFLLFVVNEEEYAGMIPVCLTHIVTAGEQVIVNERFRTYLRENRVYLHNHYGPSETHVVTTLTLNHKGEIPELPSIGRPISNTEVYILDKGMYLTPTGVSGELYIAGTQVGRGYLNRPEITAERFILVCYKSYRAYRTYISSSKIIYKTGDLARWLADGNIEFLGRIDQQVKIRGFRVELGEIESRLLNHHRIKECVVVVRKDEKEGKYLCAYIVSQTREELDISELREYLAATLPDYMIPAFFVSLEKLPLNPAGKVNRQALPKPEPKAGEEYIAPRNAVEKRLADIWSEVLGIEKNIIGIDTNFFSMGGHSLKATILATKIHKELDVKIPLAEVFKNPHIRGLAEYINGTVRDEYAAIAAVETKEYYALSSAQKRLYILQQMEFENTVYNMPQIIPLPDEFDIGKMESVFLHLLERHESLRTSFSMINQEPVQRIHDANELEFSIEYYNLAAANPSLPTTFIRPFELSQAPLLRVGVMKIGAAPPLLLIDMHHIITDGISREILEREFAALYSGEELPPLRLQYRDFSEWRNNNRQQALIKYQEAYWINLFSDEIPVLNLPTDYPRPPVQGFEGNWVSFTLSGDETRALKNMANVCNATLYMTILAVWTILLSRLSGQEDIIVGTPIAARRHADLEKIIGMFVNTLALRNCPSAEKRVMEFLVELKEQTLAAYENQEYPFEELVDKVGIKRDAGRSPVFDVMFALQNFKMRDKKSQQPNKETAARTTESKQEVHNYEYEHRIAKFDMTLAAVDEGESLYFDWEYCTWLFKNETIKRFIRYFKKIISSVDREPGIKIGQIDIITEEDKRQVLYDFNTVEAEYPKNKTIHRLFEEQAARMPDKIALVGGWQLAVGKGTAHPADKKSHGAEESHAAYRLPHPITYRELNQKSNQLAHYLRTLGVKENELVGLLAERSIEMIAAILGILKAGCGYVPLDPDAPMARTGYMLDECKIRILVSGLSEVRGVSGGIEVIDLSSIILENEDAEPIRLTHPGLPAHLCYIIYTSGSTGKPKGVAITHSNLCPLLHWGYKHSGIGRNDRIIQNLSYYFDWSVWEIFITLTSGASLYIAPGEILVNAEDCIAFMNENRITVLHVTPTQFGYYVKVNQKLATLKYLFLGAEKLTYDLVNRSFESVPPECRIFNMYGPTEAAIISSVLEIDRSDCGKFANLTSVPIGRPVANTALLVLDRNFKLCPVNVTGELYISGDGVAVGYINHPELTAEKFKKDVICHSSLVISSSKSTNDQCPMTNDRLYRTGDLARWLPDGNIEFLGRIDHQVKIRGFRIELGEIEKQLLKIEGINEAVVMDRKDRTGQTYLCAYIVSKPGMNINPGDIKNTLAQVLPAYMIPAYVMQVDNIPLTPNGKVDRRALPGLEPGLKAADNYTAPGNEMEEKMVEIWADVLGAEKQAIGVKDNFFERGGHSLKATILTTKINNVFNVRIPLKEIFKTPTVEGVCSLISVVEWARTQDRKINVSTEGEEIIL